MSSDRCWDGLTSSVAASFESRVVMVPSNWTVSSVSERAGRTSVKTMKGAAAWGRLATVMAVGRGEAKAAVSLGSVDGDDERGVGGGP